MYKRQHLRCLRDAGAPVLTKPADVPALGPAAEELFTLESRCTDLYVLAVSYTHLDVYKRQILRMFFQIMQGFISCDRGKDTWLWRNKVR